MKDNLSWQVCDLKYAELLKELGVPQESLWYWFKTKKDNIIANELYINECKILHLDEPKRVASAFTVAELGEKLKDNTYYLPVYMLGFKKPKWKKAIEKNVEICREDTEANARAKMLIYLLEKGLVKL